MLKEEINFFIYEKHENIIRVIGAGIATITYCKTFLNNLPIVEPFHSLQIFVGPVNPKIDNFHFQIKFLLRVLYSFG